MAKLRVGDIEIENDNVRIAGPRVTNRPAAWTPRSSGSIHPWLWISRLPLPGRFLGLAGASLLTAGTVAAFFGSVWADPVRAFARGGFLVPLGVGVIGLAFAKGYLERSPNEVDRLAVGTGVDQMLDELRTLLAPGSKRQTVEWIQARTGLSEDTVVRLLAILRGRGRLSEELDPESGEFYYRITRIDPLDLDERLASINKGAHQ